MSVPVYVCVFLCFYYEGCLEPSACLWGQCCIWSVKQPAFSLPCQNPGRAFRQGVWRSRTTAQEGNHYLTVTPGWRLMVLATSPPNSFARQLYAIPTRMHQSTSSWGQIEMCVDWNIVSADARQNTPSVLKYSCSMLPRPVLQVTSEHTSTILGVGANKIANINSNKPQ